MHPRMDCSRLSPICRKKSWRGMLGTGRTTVRRTRAATCRTAACRRRPAACRWTGSRREPSPRCASARAGTRLRRQPGLRQVATVMAPAVFPARCRPVRDSRNAARCQIWPCGRGRSWPSISKDWWLPGFVQAQAVAASAPFRGAASRRSRARSVSTSPPVPTAVRVQYGHCLVEDLADQVLVCGPVPAPLQ